MGRYASIPVPQPNKQFTADSKRADSAQPEALGCQLFPVHGQSCFETNDERPSGAKQVAEKVRTKSEFDKGWIGRGKKPDSFCWLYRHD
jgi:hypothetical protein